MSGEGSIFISYRRSDAGGWAGRLSDSLKVHLRGIKIFRDIEDIPPGVEFESYITEALSSCTVLIALIGPQWSAVADGTGHRRLNDAADFIRREISAALQRNIRVIPALVGGAKIPSIEELPEELKPLVRRQAYELTDGRWADDCRKLAEVLKPLVRSEIRRDRKALAGIALLLCFLVGTGFIWYLKTRTQTKSADMPTSANAITSPQPSTLQPTSSQPAPAKPAKSSFSSTPTQDTAEGIGSIAVGVIMPISGREGKPGQYQKEGIELAIKQINDQGGVSVKGKKYPIKEVFYDDGSDSAKSATLAERAMSSDKATAVIGGYSTALGEAEAVMPDRYQTPWITPGAAASSIFSHNYKYVFGTLSPILLLGTTTADFLGSLVDQGKLRKGLKIALAVENTDHGIDYVNGVQDWISKHPGYFTVVFNEKFGLGGTDFLGLLQKVKASRADIFLSDAHLQDYITMQRQYLQAGMHHQMISYGARGTEANARQALGDGTNYIFAGLWWSDKLPYPQVQQFIKDYKAFTGRDPDSWYAAIAYDSVRILAQAIASAGSLDKAKIRDALSKAELKNSLLPGAELKFSPTGQAEYPFVIVQNKLGNKVDVVYPKNSVTGEAIAPTP